MKGAEPIFIDKKSKTGILMLHGFTSTPDQFKELAAFLSQKGFSVSAPLVAGHGTHPDDLIKTSPEDWKKSVRNAYLKLKEICPKIFIIGNSFGSNLGLWLAEEFDNEQAGIITLGAPIFLKNHLFNICRIYSYGFIKKYYHKPPRIYRTDYIDMSDEITYPVMPTKSLRDFLRFIKKETIPGLAKVKIPVFVGHANHDKVVHPRSATYIYEHLGSCSKKIFWFPSNLHSIIKDKRSFDIFQKIYDLIKETT